MTVELLDEAPDDAEEVLIAWLKPLFGGRVATARRSDDPLPFIVVTLIDGNENIDESYAEPVLSVHTLCDRELGWEQAKIDTADVHKRMLYQARFLDDVELSDGRIATVDYVNVFSMPRWERYDDEQILRKVGRYQLGLPYVRVA